MRPNDAIVLATPTQHPLLHHACSKPRWSQGAYGCKIGERLCQIYIRHLLIINIIYFQQVCWYNCHSNGWIANWYWKWQNTGGSLICYLCIYLMHYNAAFRIFQNKTKQKQTSLFDGLVWWGWFNMLIWQKTIIFSGKKRYASMTCTVLQYIP